MTVRPLVLLLGLTLPCGMAVADSAPLFGRYMPLYPGQYFQFDYSIDDGDSLFDGQGRRVDTAVPSWVGQTQLPRTTMRGTVSWHMPLFETYAFPFFSSRTHSFSLSWEHVDTRTEGSLVDFLTDTDDDATTDADDLRNNGRGVGDLSFEFGSFLYGSSTPDWRTRESTPFAVLLKLGGTLNFGEHDRDAPTNAGNNTAGLHALLGLHWQPWSGGFVDLGYRIDGYVKNQDPAFGALWPSQPGDRFSLDFSIAQRLRPGLYLSAFWTDSQTDPNRYSAVRFAPNQPPAPDENSDTVTTPGNYFDHGTTLTTMGVGLRFFISQRLLLGLHWQHPTSGNSAEFDLDYSTRRPRGCTIGADGCELTPQDTRITDGFGPGRVFASDRIMLSLQFQFLERDLFDCIGCTER